MDIDYGHDGWDSRNEDDYGSNDVSATVLRQYSPSPSPPRPLSRSPSPSRDHHHHHHRRSPASHHPHHNDHNDDDRALDRRGYDAYDRRSRSRSPRSTHGRRDRPSYRSRSRSPSRGHYHRRGGNGNGRRGRSPDNKAFAPQAPPRHARENPEPTNVLGIFNLDYATDERALRELFEPYGGLERVMVVTDRRTRQSRGFAFAYFADVTDATRARDATNGKLINDRGIRVDYSVTREAHKPTPGVYMGEPARGTGGRSGRYGSHYNGGGGSGGGGGGSGHRYRRRSRSRSRSRGRYGGRSYHRDVSPPPVAYHRYRSRSRSR
ncbi:hypothetical protein SYNPS1DRAFT_29805 [Syncephalis pseudoplumigaleata]|uniref:RRM domain-containing protein n=1 Tax=Syncephalis pseudoplumigaleata TaxID=1712513 RepID=A0A4P9YWN4_9FUNG|nr:hypothetical protein SYNPS1DRAFT_29805 [Syncephalis pseudoplumigaleata]|eukprot:RKP24437.1 hypothetical protein SYNPS1DRAFT_29805 [Syncephalis pseudoplumigaleata]